MPLPAGKLTEYVELQSIAFAEDDMAGQGRTPSKVKDIWAAIEPLRGGEQQNLAQRFPTVSHKVTIRYDPGLTIKASTHRIKYGSRIFRIEAVLNPFERDETLELACQETTA